jgi:hypothetical protein
MRRVAIALALASLIAGCVGPVVLEHPATRERVNCTLEAQRFAYAPDPGPGTDVPHTRSTPMVMAFDLERQCAGALLEDGFVCLSGCSTLPR